MTDTPRTAKRRPGRPAIYHLCRYCFRDFPAGQIAKHQASCSTNPAVVRATKIAKLDAAMVVAEQQVAERIAAQAQNEAR